jgi:hypothetical protein
VQRLVREDGSEMLAWNPIQDELIYRVSALIEGTEEELHQHMVLTSINQRDTE